MGSIAGLFSQVSGHFSKSLLLGFLFPVALFVLLFHLLVIPLLPPDWFLLQLLAALPPEWGLVTASLLTIVLSGVLYNLNTPITRLYEGYSWRESRVGKRWIERQKKRWTPVESRWRGVRSVARALSHLKKATQNDGSSSAAKEPTPPTSALVNKLVALTDDTPTSPLRSPETLTLVRLEALQAKIEQPWHSYGQTLNIEFPPNESKLLPTRLGNVIRSFEEYSLQQYGMEAIILWPRLIDRIDQGYAQVIADTKTTFDFMLNSSFLSALLTLAMLFAGLWYLYPFTTLSLALRWIIEIILFGALSLLFYQLSIPLAATWGTFVKSAFDLYRWDLLGKLGHSQKPTSKLTERSLWTKISRQIIYGDYVTAGTRDPRPRVDYADPPTPSESLPRYSINTDPKLNTDPAKSILTLSRGVTPGQDNVITVVLSVKNTNNTPFVAQNVVVKDRQMEGFQYLWGTAELRHQAVPVHEEDSYFLFTCGQIPFAAGEEVLLTYGLVSLDKTR